jgi:hypothetical protein
MHVEKRMPQMMAAEEQHDPNGSHNRKSDDRSFIHG